MARLFLVSILLCSAATAFQLPSLSDLKHLFDKEPVAQKWTCISVQDDVKLTASGSVFWRKENCTFVEGADPLLAVNSLHVDLSAKDVKVVPGYSQVAASPLLPIGQMAATYNSRNLIAGINGGYFWRTDITPFWLDDVCRTKFRKEAEQSASPDHVNYGIHDGVVMSDGVTVGNNCDCWGYSRPAVCQQTANGWEIEVLTRGEKVKAGVTDALGAGPNLVSVGSDGASFIDIPADDDNINIHEHAANTAVGIVQHATQPRMVMVTTDGSDECGRLDQTCGLNSPNLASLMLLHFGVSTAMSMDQGGSTTMWVKDAAEASANKDGVVSFAGGGARSVANGLFIEAVAL